MNIHVKGGSKSQKKHIRSMVEFCVGKMMPRMGNSESQHTYSKTLAKTTVGDIVFPLITQIP